MQANDGRYHSLGERKEKAEAALARLKFLKCRISELRAECEALTERPSEKQESLTCYECGKLIVQGEEVTLKDSFGRVKSHYHKECFKAIWLSQKWTFGYSSPGFLSVSGKDQ